MKINSKTYKDSINQSLEILNELDIDSSFNIESDLDLLKAKLNSFKNASDKLIEDSKLLRIGIVGQVKAGKSSFLNSLFFDGKDVLPKASTPMTAGLVIIEYAEENSFEIEYYTNEDWSIFENERKYFLEKYNELKRDDENLSEYEINSSIKENFPELASAYEIVDKITFEAKSKIGSQNESESFTAIDELQGKFEKYVGASGNFTSVVKSITLKIKNDNLKHIQIIDTPGVNDPVISREQKTKEILKTCHGVFLLSYAGQFFSQEDQNFLKNRIGSEGIQEVVVIASKYDSAIQDVWHQYENDLGGAVYTVQKSIEESWNSRKKENPFLEKLKLDLISSYLYKLSLLDSYDNIIDPDLSHSYNNFKKQFNDVFVSNEQSKSVFLQLSNFDNLHQKYINDDFLKNKERIIANKVQDFFSSNTKNTINDIDKLLNILQSKLDILNNQDLGSLKETQNELANNKKQLENDFNKPLKKFVGKLKENLTNEINKLSQDINMKLIQPESSSIQLDTLIKKYALWRNKTKKIGYDFACIDYSKFKIGIEKINEQLVKNTIHFVQSASFKNDIKELNDQLTEVLNKILISKASIEIYNKNGIIEEKIKEFIESHFALIDNQLENSFNRCFEIFFKGEKFNYKEIYDINRGKIELRENEVEQKIKEMNLKINQEIKSFFENTKCAVIGEVKKKLIDNKFNNIDKTATELTKEVLKYITAIFEDDIKMLEQNINSKEQAKEKVSNHLEKIKKMRVIYV